MRQRSVWPLLAMGSLIGTLSLTILLRASDIDAPVADAARRDDVDVVSMLVKHGADVNAAQGDGMTALHWAAMKGDAKLLRLLLRAGANINARTRLDAETPLHRAGMSGNAEVIELLLNAGANVNAVTGSGTTPLMLAAGAGNPGAVKQLVARGANVNAMEAAKGHTALMFAAAANRASALRALLELGADPNATTTVFDLSYVEMSVDRTLQNYALTTARRAEARANTKPAVAGVDRGYEYNELVGSQGGLTALLFAARQGYIESVKAILDAGADVNQMSAGVKVSPLLIAAINGQFDLAMYLLERGANPNLIEENGVAPLYAVVNCQWSPDSEYPQPQAYLQQRTSYLDLLKALLDKGADPNLRIKKKVWYSGYSRDNSGVDEGGATAFWRAAHSSDVDAMRLLIAHGADPNIATASPAGRTPVGGPGATPLHAAAGDGFLQDYAGNGHHSHPAGWMPAVRYLVEELGANVNARDHEGNTALHYAAARGDNQMVLYLVSKGADVTVVNRRGQTTVDAANGPRQRVQPYPDTIKILEGLGAKNNHKCVSC